jgi:hypothetical protein
MRSMRTTYLSEQHRRLLDRLTEGERDRLLQTLDLPDESLGRARWCCAACGHGITGREQSIEVAGKFVHRFVNPAGLVFDIGCFREASGCVAVGEPVLEWTWFATYRWQVAVCGRCSVQLGWRYTGGGSFFGLILERLAECGRKSW